MKPLSQLSATDVLTAIHPKLDGYGYSVIEQKARALDTWSDLQDLLQASNSSTWKELAGTPAAGNTPAARFIKCDAAGVALPPDTASWPCVLDRELGLIWAVESLGGPDGVPHARACELVRSCGIGGQNDWRLPTIRELLTLVDYERKDPAIDVALFPGTKSDWYWTSTAWAGSPGSFAWGVLFYDGGANYLHHDDDGFVRAVRSVARASAGQ